MTPTLSILTIGDEILIGQIHNTNAAWLGQQALEIGHRVTMNLTVGDNPQAITQALATVLAHSSAVIITGGLGPTHDDITVETIAAALNRPLIENAQWVKRMEELFAARGRTMTQNNRKQALCPQHAELINNPVGTACGHHIKITKNDGLPAEHIGKSIFILPGVPYEMKAMFSQYIAPQLAAQTHSTHHIYVKTLKTAGVGESVLAEKVGDIAHLLTAATTTEIPTELAYLPTLGEVKLRVLTQGSTAQAAHLAAQPLLTHIRHALTHYVYGEDEDTLESAIGKLLTENNATIAVAESCTGGLVNHKLTNTPGSSRYINGGIITYSNEVKTAELGVPTETLAAHGAVSEAVAIAMAQGVRRKFNATLGLAVTGIAGPDGGTPQKPVGTVCMAVCDANGVRAYTYRFESGQKDSGQNGSRERNKERFAVQILNLARLRLLGIE